MFFRASQDVDRSCETTLAKWQSGSLYRLLRFFIAAVLFVAALLKAHQLATTPSLGDGLLHNRWLNILVVEFEILFATWLVTGILPRIAWFVSTCCFTTFAIVSLAKGFAGETSCGCFGAQEVNPWLTFTLDAAIVGGLVLLRPTKAKLQVYKSGGTASGSSWLMQTASMTTAIAFFAVVQILLFFGPFIGFDGFLSTHDVEFTIDRSVIPSDGNTVLILATNNTDKPITIVGARTDCKCGKIDNLPVSVRPGMTSTIRFVAAENTDRAARAKRKQTVIFFVDAEGTRKTAAELPLFEFLEHFTFSHTRHVGSSSCIRLA
ncbi:MAG: MauE/DoxX family redox-associated membrane protein [Thermoguttaceae bacterium]